MTTPETGGQPVEALHPALQPIIDAIDLDRARPEDAGRLADIQIKYGSPEVREVALGRLQERIDMDGYMYVEEVAQFVHSNPDYGAPSHIAKYESDPEGLDIYDVGYSEDFVASVPVPHEETHRRLEGWLATAREHEPAAAATLMQQLLQAVIENYDAEGFALASRFDHWRNQRFARDAGDLADQVARDIAKYSGSAELIEQGLDAPFITEWCSPGALLDLECALAAQLSAATPEEAGAYYETVVDTLDYMLAPAPDDMGDFAPTIEQLSKTLPSALERLARDHPKAAGFIYLHAGKCAMTAVGAAAGKTQSELLVAEIGTDVPSTTQLDQLVGLYRDQACSKNLSAVESLIAMHLDIQELRDMCTDNQSFFQIPTNRIIAARRFAAAGEIDLAYEVLAIDADYFIEAHAAIVHGLLDVYAITGDEGAYQRAEAWFNEHIPETDSDYHEYHYGQAFATMVAARARGNTVRAAAAAETLDAYDKSDDAWQRGSQLRYIIKEFVGQTYLDDVAQRLGAYVADMKRSPNDPESAYAMALEIVRAYQATGNTAAAARAINGCFMDAQTYPKALVKALDAVVPRSTSSPMSIM